MVKISGFYDEVTSDFEEKCKAVKAFGETYMCPRVVNGKNTTMRLTTRSFPSWSSS